MVERITVSMDEELYDRLGEELDYGDSRSAWVRRAIENRLEDHDTSGNLTAVQTTAD